MKRIHLSYGLNIVLIGLLAFLSLKPYLSTCEIGDSYLEETFYCNYSDPLINELDFSSSSTSKTALKIFNYVQDSVPLTYDDLNTKATEVLKSEGGACWNKALLMTALLRKHEIPSKIVKVPLDPEFLRALAGDFVENIPSPFYHCYVQVNLDGKWIYADPSVDIESFNRGYRPLNLSWNNEWDGETDQVIHTQYILGPVEVIEDIDKAYGTTIGNEPWLI